MPTWIDYNISRNSVYVGNGRYYHRNSQSIGGVFVESSRNLKSFLSINKDKFVNIHILNYLYYFLIHDYDSMSYDVIKKMNDIVFKNISYIEEYDNGYVLINRTQKIKFGKILNRMFNIIYGERNSENKTTFSQIEQIVNEYKSWFVNKDNFKFDYLNGEDILKGYDRRKQVYNDSTLGHSCMNNKDNYLKIYTKNLKKVSLLVLYNYNNQICGRALIWTLDNKKELFMDRIYYADDFIRNMFVKYAQENKMIYRSGGSEENFYIHIPNKYGDYDTKNANNIKLKTKLNTKNIKKYPYMDSFFIKRGNTFSTNLKYSILTIYSKTRNIYGKKEKRFKFV